MVVNSYPHSDKAHIHADIVGVNRYFGWYQDTGHTELIARQMFNHLKVYCSLVTLATMIDTFIKTRNGGKRAN